MLTFLLFILAGVGITNLVVNATILDNPRDFIIKHSPFLGKLITCMMCSGFWIGFLIGPFFNIGLLWAGPAISLLSYSFGILIEWMEISMAVNALELDKAEQDENE